MTRLDRFLPAPQLRQIDHIDVGAPLDRTWLAVRHFDLARSPFVAALFALRTMPERVRGRAATHEHLRLDDLTAPDSGFRILDEGPAWITVGAIGKVWQPEQTRLHVRVRAAFGPKGFNLQALTAPLIHHVMETAQLRDLRQRVETARVAL
ncbi:MAG: hypothetical protein JO098_04420 [Candidatus Eremiobacteraeota bacterium]|nr:hypothetical protein [Candidatus Eremiobacteraeota bacterium]